MDDQLYRFPKYKDATWNSYDRQKQRYNLIKHLLGKRTVGAEIGVYKGGFGEFLLPHCKRLYLVDPWYRLKSFWGGAGTETKENSSVRAFIDILNVYESDIESGRVHVILDFAIPFMKSLQDKSLDWIYLDASHSYASTKQELESALNVVKAGGFIIGDDYDADPASNQHGVFLAVNEVLMHTGRRLVVDESRQWAFQV